MNLRKSLIVPVYNPNTNNLFVYILMAQALLLLIQGIKTMFIVNVELY